MELELDQMDRVLEYLYLRVPRGINRAEILREVFPAEKQIPIDAVLFHLKKEGFIFTPIRVDNNIGYDMLDYYSMTHPGMYFFKTSAIAGKPYQSKEAEHKIKLEQKALQVKYARKEDFPKQQWMVLPLITFALGIISATSGEFIKRKIWPDTKSNSQIMIIHDTIRVATPLLNKH